MSFHHVPGSLMPQQNRVDVYTSFFDNIFYTKCSLWTRNIMDTTTFSPNNSNTNILYACFFHGFCFSSQPTVGSNHAFFLAFAPTLSSCWAAVYSSLQWQTQTRTLVKLKQAPSGSFRRFKSKQLASSPWHVQSTVNCSPQKQGVQCIGWQWCLRPGWSQTPSPQLLLQRQAETCASSENKTGVALIVKFCINTAFFKYHMYFSHIAVSPYAKQQHRLNELWLTGVRRITQH